ncbi:conserved hypothetical protein [Magnetospirillum molischianum DSM 120]|uniref:Uncharacterized protein n=2 Tax=Magnetospirillum molischianum TaxID=1083 RepID=H8FVV6_MAGML|nr:conserved hypothetical protein [Magnetospirillum molischianum DSM 120]
MTANAGVLNWGYNPVGPEQFFDWKYAQKVWFDLNTAESYDAEWAKYQGDFKPWLALYKADKRKALAELKSYPEAKRRNIERGYDMQLAYDDWRDLLYMRWYKGYAHEAYRATLTKKKAQTFDDSLAIWVTFKPCVPVRFLNQCGPIPDWRDDEDKAKEQAMMRKVVDDLAARAAKK